MSIITFDTGHAPATASAAKRRGLLARLFARLIEAREKQAMDLIRRHGIRLPHELEAAGLKINERSEDSLPFVR